MSHSSPRRRPRRPGAPVAAALVAASLAVGCSPRGLAINALANALAASGDVFASDADPELVRDATPFALKTMESLLAERPDHPGLLLAACRGFTQYAYAFVELDAERLVDEDYSASQAGYDRARGLYLRGRDYCLEALDRRAPGIRARLERQPHAAVEAFGGERVELLYWTGASWGAAISISLDRPEITADLEAVRALMDRVEALDERWGKGAVHEAQLSLASLPEAMGGSPEEARSHFERAVELSGGKSAGPFVLLAEKVSVRQQDRDEFERLLRRALQIDPDADPPNRLANVLHLRRARWLLERADELFL